jgi:hypothetical protein
VTNLAYFVNAGDGADSRGTLPAPVPRAPLPPFEGVNPDDGLPVNTVQPANLTIPARPNLRFHRGNMCGLRLAGLPMVPGGGPAPLVLTWFLDRYSVDDQQKILTALGQAGYSHIYLSWPDSRAYGQTPDQFVATCRRVKRRGFYVGVFWGSKDIDPWNETVAGWPTRALPLMQQLVAANVIDFAMPGWEWNFWNVPGDQTYDIFKFFSANLPGVALYYHGSVGNISWQADGQFSASFYSNLVNILTGCLYQAGVGWSAGFLQAKINDVTDRFSGNFGFPPDSGFGHPFDCVAFEISATSQFDGGMTEDFGDLRGLEALYTLGPIAVMGYGNGCRRPDGTAL